MILQLEKIPKINKLTYKLPSLILHQSECHQLPSLPAQTMTCKVIHTAKKSWETKTKWIYMKWKLETLATVSPFPKDKKETTFIKTKANIPKKKKKTEPHNKKTTENTWFFDDKVVTGWTALCCKDINFKNPKLTAFCDFKEQISGLVRRNSFWETK